MDEPTKNVLVGTGTAVASAGGVGLVAWVTRWVVKVGKLPKRVDRLERTDVASTRLLLAMAEDQMAVGRVEKAKAREGLRTARGAMIEHLTAIEGGGQ